MRLSNEDALAVQFGLFTLAMKVLMAKRRGYSGKEDPYGNFRSSSLRGVEPWRSVMVRCDDKIARRMNIMESGADPKLLETEKFFDPHFDQINYICIEGGLEIEELEAEDLLKELYREAEELIPLVRELAEEHGLDVGA